MKSKAVWRRGLRWSALAAIVALLVVTIVNSRGGLPPGTAVPAIVGELLDGTAFSSAGFGGRPAVINFWATWCPPCLAELPEFERAHRTYGDRVAFVGLALESGSRREVAEVVQRFGLSYPIVLPRPEVQGAFRITSFPTTIVVAPDGRVAHCHAGTVDFELLTRELAPLLDPGQS
ncbi:MAG: TlpA family protein disulfide reductase [Deltaproteobacteria bacterium]|nr:TlpA family protein disulfide reductase [Deltaproteobacteria bacterium]